MKRIFGATILISLFFFAFTSEKNKTDGQDEYVCLPCGASCDKATHKGPGKCEQCNMALVKKSTIKHKEIQPKDLCAFITKKGSGNVVLLDVRTVAEFEGKGEDKFGRLSNAVNIPVQDENERAGKI